jgi:2-polyprenyl-3-methyl-5-hydroxy-6-metoxy-1,4-benzoquinol methylase
MDRLTEKHYWDGLYKNGVQDGEFNLSESGIKRFIKRAMGKKLFNLLAPYDDYLLWDSVFPAYLPANCEGLSVLEIGSAPGKFLVRFANKFGANPYGVEYTKNGAELNRFFFKKNGIQSKNVIEADFFSNEFIESHRHAFDIVISRGFIEHFLDVDMVVTRHIELLRPGGLLFVLIPNLRGVYYPWTKLFNPCQLKMHNLELMKISHFQSVFNSKKLEILRCSYFGTFNFWLFTAPEGKYFVNRVIKILILVQRVLNLIFRIFFGKKGLESAVFSPNLIFVGRKN